MNTEAGTVESSVKSLEIIFKFYRRGRRERRGIRKNKRGSDGVDFSGFAGIYIDNSVRIQYIETSACTDNAIFEHFV